MRREEEKPGFVYNLIVVSASFLIGYFLCMVLKLSVHLRPDMEEKPEKLSESPPASRTKKYMKVNMGPDKGPHKKQDFVVAYEPAYTYACPDCPRSGLYIPKRKGYLSGYI